LNESIFTYLSGEDDSLIIMVESPMSNIRVLADKFARDRDGSVAVLFGLSCVVLVGLVGLAVDTSRYYNYSSKMQQSLDAATLAGAKMLPDDSVSDGDIAALIQAHFTASMVSAGIAANALMAPAITIDRSKNSVSSQGSAKLPAMVSNLITGKGFVDANIASKAIFDMKKIELSMVLDITGSMNTNNKLADMKIAAKDIVDELYNVSLSEDGIRIALAPYSASVNAGQYASAVTNVPPTTSCSKVKHEWKCTDVSGVDQDTCVVERQGLNSTTGAAPVGVDKLPNVPSPTPSGYSCPPSTVLGLQGKSQRAEVTDTIDSYLATGATAGHIGTAWGWYLLSPDWAGVLGANAPKPYSDALVDKYTIIMTDGVFNRSYLTGSTDATTMANESYAQFGALCNGMKAKGIKIFTVGFDLNDPRALSELAACASGPGNFFDAKTGADLKQSFKEIAKKLNTLRVAS
jgi:Flp pilus assembly protein TadG